MEKLSPEDHQQGARSTATSPALGQQLPAQSVPQLPPQMFTTAAQLLDLTDKKILVWLRDGKKLFGLLRSWDQFGNIVLESCYERLYAHSQHLWADISRGLFVVRGENVLLIGEIDLDLDDEPLPEPWRQGKLEDVRELCRLEGEEKGLKEKNRKEKLRRLGFDGEIPGREGEPL